MVSNMPLGVCLVVALSRCLYEGGASADPSQAIAPSARMNHQTVCRLSQDYVVHTHFEVLDTSDPGYAPDFLWRGWERDYYTVCREFDASKEQETEKTS